MFLFFFKFNFLIIYHIISNFLPYPKFTPRWSHPFVFSGMYFLESWAVLLAYPPRFSTIDRLFTTTMMSPHTHLYIHTHPRSPPYISFFHLPTYISPQPLPPIFPNYKFLSPQTPCAQPELPSTHPPKPPTSDLPSTSSTPTATARSAAQISGLSTAATPTRTPSEL